VSGPYTPLIVDSLGTGPDDLITAMEARLAASYPGWQPVAGSPVTALLGVTAIACADLRAMVTDAGAGFLSGMGGLLQLSRGLATPATATTTWTFTDSGGHLVPAGTTISNPGGAWGDFALTTDLMVGVGALTASGVPVTSTAPGAAGNGLPTGTANVSSAQADITGVTVTSGSTGGADAETDVTYRGRVAASLQLYNVVPVLAPEYSQLAVSTPGVARALTVVGWSATTGSVGVPAAVTVVPVKSDGTPVGSTVLAQVAAALNAARGVNTLVRTTNPAYVAVTVATTIVVQAGYDPVATRAAVAAAIASYLSPATWATDPTRVPPTWNGDPLIRPWDLGEVVGAVPGVAHITTLTVNGGTDVVDMSANLPLTQSYAPLPAGTSTNAAWSTPSSITVS